jgi:acyl dehydratase
VGVNPDAAGRVYALREPFQVEASALRGFARAVRAAHPACYDKTAARALGYRDVVAPPTFAAVIAQAAQALLIADPAVGIDFSRVVHAEQRFRHNRPLVAGDKVAARLEVVAVTTRAGLTQVATRADLTSARSEDDGAPIAAVWSTLAIRPPAA